VIFFAARRYEIANTRGDLTLEYGYIPDEYFIYALLEIKKMQKGKNAFKKIIDLFHRNKHP